MLSEAIGLASALLVFAPSSWATVPPAAETSGYVVRIDSRGVYLDLGEGSGASVGQVFEIYTEGEELTHPVTGKPLGRVMAMVAKGTIREVAPLYSIGELSIPAEVRSGMRARLETKPGPAAPVPASPYAPAQTGKAPRWKSPPFDFGITDFTVADFDGTGTLKVAVASSRSIILLPYPPTDVKPLARIDIPGIAPKVLSIEAMDLNADGRAELFVSYYSETLGRAETLVFELDQTGRLKRIADIPYLVHWIQEEDGKPFLAAQRLVANRTFPFAGIYPLVFKDGSFRAGDKPLAHGRVDWLYGFTLTRVENRRTLLYITPTHRLRAQFEKGYWATDDPYEQTPLRIRWPDENGRLLEFSPRIPARYDAAGKPVLYAVRNHSWLGGISESFGLFTRGELSALSWNGIAFAKDWEAELSGYASAVALVPGPENPKEIVTAVVNASGRSELWAFDP